MRAYAEGVADIRVSGILITNSKSTRGINLLGILLITTKAGTRVD